VEGVGLLTHSYCLGIGDIIYAPSTPGANKITRTFSADLVSPKESPKRRETILSQLGATHQQGEGNAAAILSNAGPGTPLTPRTEEARQKRTYGFSNPQPEMSKAANVLFREKERLKVRASAGQRLAAFDDDDEYIQEEPGGFKGAEKWGAVSDDSSTDEPYVANASHLLKLAGEEPKMPQQPTFDASMKNVGTTIFKELPRSSQVFLSPQLFYLMDINSSCVIFIFKRKLKNR